MPQGIETLLSSPAPRYPTPVKRYGDQQENSFTFCTQNCGNQIRSMQQHPSPYNEIQPDIPSPRWTARISPGYLFSKNLHSAVKQNDRSDYNGKNLQISAAHCGSYVFFRHCDGRSISQSCFHKFYSYYIQMQRYSFFFYQQAMFLNQFVYAIVRKRALLSLFFQNMSLFVRSTTL